MMLCSSAAPLMLFSTCDTLCFPYLQSDQFKGACLVTNVKDFYLSSLYSSTCNFYLYSPNSFSHSDILICKAMHNVLVHCTFEQKPSPWVPSPPPQCPMMNVRISLIMHCMHWSVQFIQDKTDCTAYTTQTFITYKTSELSTDLLQYTLSGAHNNTIILTPL